MKRITRRGFLRLSAAAIAAGAAGQWLTARHVSGQGTPLSVKIGCVVLGDFAVTGPVLVGIEKGFFQQYGVAAEMIPYQGGPSLVKGALAGSVDLGISGATDPFVFRAAGVPIRAIATTTDKNHFTLVAAPSIRSIDELKGRTIAVTGIGATTWVFARLLAKKQGWDPERDIQIVGAGGLDAMFAGMRRGELQAFVFGDAGAVAEAQGIGRILMRMDEVTPKWVSNIAYATADSIRTKKDALQRILRGLFLANRFCRENSDETIRIVSKGIGWPEAATRRAYQLSSPLLSLDGHIDVEAFQFIQRTLIELGVLKSHLPMTDHYTTQFTPVRS